MEADRTARRPGLSLVHPDVAPHWRSPGAAEPYRCTGNHLGTQPMNSQAQRILTDIEELAPHIVARAAETEAGRRIPVDVIESLRSIGVFRMLVPRSHGGLELDLPAALDVLLALARIDGSLGWTVMIGRGGTRSL